MVGDCPTRWGSNFFNEESICEINFFTINLRRSDQRIFRTWCPEKLFPILRRNINLTAKCYGSGLNFWWPRSPKCLFLLKTCLTAPKTLFSNWTASLEMKIFLKKAQKQTNFPSSRGEKKVDGRININTFHS